MSLKDVPRVVEIKFPVHIMVRDVVSNDGRAMSTHIFEEGLRVTPNVYQNVLATVMKLWIEDVVPKRNCTGSHVQKNSKVAR